MPLIRVHLKTSPEGEFTEKHVPLLELQLLSLLGTEIMTAPALARASQGSISTASSYSLLGRLHKRGLVVRSEGIISVLDITLKRISYEVTFDEIQVPKFVPNV